MSYGTVGFPSPYVFSVQGIPGAIPLQVTGDLTVAPGTGTSSVNVVGTTAVSGAISLVGVSPVTVNGTSAITGAVSLLGTPAVSVVGTSAITGAVSVSSMPTVNVTGTTAITGLVSIGSQPAPTGTTAIAGAVSISGTPAVTVSGTTAVSGTVAISNIPAVTISGTATVSPITISQMGTATAVSGGLAGTLGVGGAAASNVAINTNPLNQGAQAVSAENVAVIAGRMVQLVADLVGKQIVLPYANPENLVSGVTPTINGTQTVLLLSAPAAGSRNYITSLSVTNAVNTGTVVGLRDGINGTTLWSGYCGTQTVGSMQLSFPAPIRQPTTGTAINCFCVTNGASVIVSAQGYKGV